MALSHRESIPVATRVLDKLRPQLATLMGKAGFRALLARALSLSSLEVTWLSTVQVAADGSLQEPEAQTDPAEIAEGQLVLLAHLLGLLVTFIGELLTLQLLREAWPTLPHNDPGSAKGQRHDKVR